jgi:L-seryl-tRNA(Ser) seleniumtransferase
VAASGDKLLGGPQCGLLIGERDVIERLRANPLFRALRVDKLTYAALQATLLAYLMHEEDSLPAIAMMRMSPHAIEMRCKRYADQLSSEQVRVEVVPTRSVVGGGTTPGASLPSFAVALRHEAMSESALSDLLRRLEPPIVARTHEGRVLLDLRTVSPTEDAVLLPLLQAALRTTVTG